MIQLYVTLNGSQYLYNLQLKAADTKHTNTFLYNIFKSQFKILIFKLER